MKFINKKIILNSSAVCSAILFYATSGTAEESLKPNVIVILTDDIGYGDLGCHNNPFIKTPNIDKLYSKSVRFTNFHVSPTCSPTRGALLTGRYPNAIGSWHTINGRNLLFDDERTMGDLFAENGYKTGFFGKWHLGDNYPYLPKDRGFQETLIHGGGGTSQTPDYWSNNNFDDRYWRDGKVEKFSGYCTDIWFNEAEKFIYKHRKKPFLAFISTNAAHAPFHVEKKYSDLYKRKGENILSAAFYGMISNIDENIGKLVLFLEENNLKENTILIFTSDNGTAKGFSESSKKGFNSGMRGIKGSVYEGGCRVPFFINWPKGHLEGGRDIGNLTAHIDLLPTLAELCHFKKVKQGKMVHGKSLVPILYGKSDNWADRTIVIDSQRVHIPIKWRNSSVMNKNWRLINGKELYDIERDLLQKNDLSNQFPKIVLKLRKEYDKWWEMVKSSKIASIPIGVKNEDEIRLTSHDWYMEKNDNSVWSQNQVREGVAKSGFWIIDVKSAGDYSIALRRWPKTADVAINSPIPAGEKVPNGAPAPKGVRVNINKARIRIAQIDQFADVNKKDKEARFNVSLKPGKYRFQTWFYSDDAPEGDITERGAYYVYILQANEN